MAHGSAPDVLFLCTGNYYRSRTAEAVFNHEAVEAGVPLWADSRGLRLNAGNKGPISKYAVAWLQAHRIPFDGERHPKDVSTNDLAGARWVIAVDESEHRR